jgi:formylglycine-generating enzyme required for sulfatase activity
MRRLIWAAPVLAAFALFGQAQKPQGGRYALLIACQDYDEKHLRKLTFPRADVTDFAKVLRETGYRDEQIVLMHDGPGQDRTLLPEADKIRDQLRVLLRGLDAEDSVVVAFAGHGVQFKGSDRQFFCPVNADPGKPATLLPLDEVFDGLKACRAGRKLLLVDACRNDPQSAFSRDAGEARVESITRPPAAEAVPKGLLALFSCDEGQRSFEHPELGHGVFFHQVIQSWKGNGGLPVTLEEFRRGVRVGTRDYVRVKFREVQTPVERGEVANPDEWVLSGSLGRRDDIGRVTGPRPLDRTGPDGASESDVKAAQQSWAKRLGRQVEESVDVGNGVTMEFVLVPPGRFLMGSPYHQDTPNIYRYERVHEVELTRPFYMAKYELTQEQYTTITGEKNPSDFSAEGAARGMVTEDTKRYPVEKVSHKMATDCAAKLTAKLNDGFTYRLPTEAEWEYACRGGRGSKHEFGVGDGKSLSGKQANFDGLRPFGGATVVAPLRRPCRVGSFAPNALGLYDMHGNVQEWCADKYRDFTDEKVTDPVGPQDPKKVWAVRGGGWGTDGWYCRSAHRHANYFEEGMTDSLLGFRLARSQ